MTDIVILKYTSSGTRVWTRMAGSANIDIGWAVAVDPNSGSVHVTGQAAGSVNGQPYVSSADIILLKYDSNGNVLWTRMAGTIGLDQGLALAWDTGSGFLYLAGRIAGSLNGESAVLGTDIILLKYANDGSTIWTRIAGSVSTEKAYGVAVDSSTGSVYVTGYTTGFLNGETFTGGSDIFLLKYADDGNLLWTKLAGTRSVYVTGSAGASLNGQPYVASDDIFVFEVTSSGTILWTRMFGSSGNDVGRALSYDPTTGFLFMTGSSGGAIDGQVFAGGNTDVLSTCYAKPPPSGQPSS